MFLSVINQKLSRFNYSFLVTSKESYNASMFIFSVAFIAVLSVASWCKIITSDAKKFERNAYFEFALIVYCMSI